MDFPEGALLLSGDIGSGKTSILLAIEYALFGLQPGQTGFALLRNNEQFGEVTLTLDLEGNEVIIERKLKRGKNVTNDYSAITINGEKTESSVTELKTKIISLLNYPQEFIKKNNILYRYTVYTPQEQMKLIISEDPEVRLNIIRHIFGVDKYKSIRDNTLILISKIKEESKLLQGEISSLDLNRNRLSSVKSFIVLLEEKIKEHAALLSIKKERRKKIELESLELEKKIKEREKLETELEKAKVLLSIKKENLSSVLRDYNEIKNLIIQQQQDFDESAYSNVINDLESNLKESEKFQNIKIVTNGKIQSLLTKRKDFLSRKERFFNITQC
jgi:DNA repair protein SbcC/Rad50